jgi:putative intracellular protease/amidase
MFDLEHNEDALKITAAAYEAGKVVGAVCHGPIALTDVKLSDGTLLVKGKNVTGFSDDEEKTVQLDHGNHHNESTIGIDARKNNNRVSSITKIAIILLLFSLK